MGGRLEGTGSVLGPPLFRDSTRSFHALRVTTRGYGLEGHIKRWLELRETEWATSIPLASLPPSNFGAW